MHEANRITQVNRAVQILIMFVILGLVCSNPVFADDVRQALSVAEDPQILWKVESQQNTIYLAGSIHVLQKEHYPLHEAFEDAFNQSSRVMFEVDLAKLSSSKAQITMLQNGLYRHGETLLDVLSPKNYAIAKTQLSGLGLEIEAFHRMKPWMTATAVMALELQKIGYESAYGVDRHFFEKAQVEGKPIHALETVEFQLSLFDQLSSATQEQFLLQTLEELNNLDQQVREMVKAWEQGNIQELELLLAGMSEYPELHQALVINRNLDWLPSIEQALQEQEPVFIVVGALHLLGKEGLITSLQEKGYEVQQL